ncbi:hypothetical protein P6281_10595 [Mycobacterium sp. 5-140-3-2]|uniref:hypothetical protein n=1 Tax=Mycobacterium TaxID=1763 RepID=UPI001925A0B0|nr:MULTISPECIES: hypothetical protein [Mycobacterium]WRU84285.1 hypothetical protein P6281_10595 [Mycobacterium sp. 5-140-3-2]WSE39571.1 hypothetical protein QGN28_15520 [Mycobacterium sp. 5-140-3-1]BCO83704.1 hypothetical protein MINTM011_20390 [Mycobacterium paraintracellulare]
MVTTRDDIIKVLSQAAAPLSVTEIATALGRDVGECDAILWQEPHEFVWQPGHKWMLASVKSHSPPTAAPVDLPDARTAHITSSPAPRQLRALTLSSGVVIAVNRRPLDSDAFFTIRSAGNTITVTLNSTHELFTSMPTPFEENKDSSPYKKLCEVLLSAWALYEDALPGGSIKRATEDARLLWGRRVIEMLRESGND